MILSCIACRASFNVTDAATAPPCPACGAALLAPEQAQAERKTRLRRVFDAAPEGLVVFVDRFAQADATGYRALALRRPDEFTLSVRLPEHGQYSVGALISLAGAAAISLMTLVGRRGVRLEGALAGAMYAVAAFVALGAAYLAAVARLNRTTIAVRGGRLTVRHGPLPISRSVALEAASVAQLFCDQERIGHPENPQISYRLCAALESGDRVVLLRNFKSPAAPLYLEHLIEARMHIEDAPVAGEYVG